MPQQPKVAVQRDFKAGLITEATGLNYPENACVDTQNCEFDLLGRVQRRDGFDFESNYSSNILDKSGCAITTYFWKNVTGSGLVSFAVVQIGSTLYFYDTSDTSSLSHGLKATTINLATYSPAGAPDPKTNECQFSDGFGKLFVVHPYLDAFYVTYTEIGDTIVGTKIDLKIRDFEGLVDENTIDQRPITNVAGLTKEHHYNLLNQGWTETLLATWDAAFTTMPSNCDVWWYYKNASNVFDTTVVPNVLPGNTAANKGHYILNLYSQDRTTASGVAAITIITTATNRATTTSFFAGRVWYSGINYPGFNTKVYFSQIIESATQFGLCYQANDPTSEELFDIEVTDGGVIDIPECGTIYKLFPTQSSLLVFASKGVWSISGSTGLGFTATDFVVRKISSVRALSGSSFIDVNGLPVYWTADGIFTVEAQQLDGNPPQFQVKPMSYTTIQTFYDEIPVTSKKFARGFFNPQTQIVQWLYSKNEPSTAEDNFTFDGILIFNARSQAFYPWTISDTNVKVHGIFAVESAGANIIEYPVIDAAVDNVIDRFGNQVVAYATSAQTISPLFKYLISYPFTTTFKFTFADNNDPDYIDWFTYDSIGEEYVSYFTTGYKLQGQGLTRFQAPYILMYNEGNGVYDIQGIWDYALSGSTGKYTTKQRLTYNDALYSNMHKKIKLRGSGRSMQFKVTSVGGETFNIIGWAALDMINQVP